MATLEALEDNFPNLVSLHSIGQTYQGNSILTLKLSTSNDFKPTNKTAILFNGAHHARELTSISMNVYMILRLIYEYTQGEPTTTYLLTQHDVYFIPVVNTDGLILITQIWREQHRLEYIRKNRNAGYQ